MTKTIPLNTIPTGDLSENALVEFIRKERKNIIKKVHVSYPSLREEQIEDVFQDVCIALVEKAKDENFRLTSSLFYYVYKCCWNKAEHDTRHPEREWELPDENILKDDADFEEQPIKQEKVDELLDIVFESRNEWEALLEKVADVVKDLPGPCDKILYGMYGEPKKKQEEIAKECGYTNADVVKTMASRCKSKFRDKFNSIYEAFKRGL